MRAAGYPVRRRPIEPSYFSLDDSDIVEDEGGCTAGLVWVGLTGGSGREDDSHNRLHEKFGTWQIFI